MKLNHKNPLLLAAISLTLTAPSAFAASSIWDGSEANANWSTALNWGSGAPGDTASTTNTDIATFNAAIANTWGSTALIPVIVDANRNILSFNFNLAAGNFFIGSTAGNAVLLSSGGTTQVNSGLTNATFAGTINAPLIIQGASGIYTFTQNGLAGSLLTIGGGITGAAAGATVITLNGNNVGTNTISGIIGNGSATTMAISKSGSGTWILSGANTYSGDTTVTLGQLRGYVVGTSLTPTSPFSSSTIKLNGGLLGVRATGTVNTTPETVTFGNNVVVGGSAVIDVNRPSGTGTVKTMAMGTLSIGTFTLGITSGSTYGLSFGATTLTGNATFNPSTGTTTNVTLGAVGEDVAGRTLTKTGPGVLILGAVNTYTGTTTVSAGTLTLNFAAGSDRIVSGNALVLSGGTLNYLTLGTNTQTFGSTTLSGSSASLITRGAGYTSGVSDLGTLSGAGALDVNNLAAGTTWIKASGNPSEAVLLNGSVTANSGASLVQTDLNGNLQTVATTDYQNTVSIGSSPGVSIRLISTGAATPLTTGASTGFVGLSDAGTTNFETLQNNYTTGTSTIDVTFGDAANILRMGATGVITSSTGATLTIGTALGANTNVGVLTAGGAADTAGGLYLNNAQAVTINSAITNNGTGVVLLSKVGAGTLTLSGSNTYTGATTLNAGTLSITHNNALGATAGATTINGGNGTTGNTLNLPNTLTTDLTIADDVNFRGNAIGRAKLASGSAQNHTFTGAIDLDSDTNIVEFNQGSTGSVTFTGDFTGDFTGAGNGLLLRGDSTNALNRLLGKITLTGGGISKTDIGTWLIGATGKTYNAPTLGVANGTLKMGVADYLAAGVALTMGNSTGGSTGTLDLNGFSQKVASIFYNGAGTATGTRTITNSDSVNAATLTVDNATDNPSLGTSVSTNNVVLTGNLGLTKTGAGKLVLPGANTYTGATLISNGSLELGTGTSSTTGSLTATSSITNNGNLSINRNDAFSQATGLGAGVAITGSGSFTQAGTGTTTLTNASNAYTGDTTITAGILSVGLTGHLGAATADLIFDGGTLQITGTTLDKFSTIGHPVSFNAAKTVGININDAAHTFTADQVLNQTSGGLTKSGTGTVILNQANTYTGITTVSAGTLQIDNPLALPSASQISLPKTGVATGTLKLNTSGTNVYTNTFGNFSSSNTLVNGGTPNIQNVQGNNTLTGDMIINGTGGNGVNFQSDAGLLTLSGNLTTGTVATGTRSYTFSGAGNGVFSGVMSPFDATKTPSIIKFGAGTWSVTGINSSFTGGVSVLDGVLNVASLDNTGSNSSIGAGGPINLSGMGTSGTLQYTGSTAMTTDHALNVAPTGGTIDASGTGSGTLKFTGTFTATNASGTTIGYINGSNVATNGSAGIPGTVGGGVMTIVAAGLAPGTTITSISGNSYTLSTPFTGTTGGVATTYTDNVARTLTLTGSNTGANEISSIMGNSAGGGVLSIAKTGTGKWRLSGVNTYSGNTTVSGGTLTLENVNPSNEASTVTIATGATLDLTYAGTDTVDKLFIGGVQQDMGIYGPTATPIPGRITNSSGTGTLTVLSSPPSGYSSWASINGATLDRSADHDKDGVSNGVEFFIGGTTLPQANTTGFTPLPSVVNTAGVRSVTWTKSANYTGTYGTDFVVETSATLTGVWAPQASPGAVVITGNDVKYTFPAGTINFARLKVTGP